jgi:hypothetical protein
MGLRTRIVLPLLALAFSAPAGAAASSNPVVSALQKTASANSSRIEIAVTTRVQGQVVTSRGSAVQRGRSIHMTMRVGNGVLATPMEAIGLIESGHFVIYLKSPVLDPELPAGKSWLKIDLQKQGALLGVDFSSLVNGSPTQSPRVVASGLVATRRAGTATVAGRSATHYRVIVDLDRAAAANPAARASIARLEQLTGVKRIPEDVWVGSDGRVSRFRFDSVVAAKGIKTSSTTTMTYLAYDVPASIEAPPAARVYEP